MGFPFHTFKIKKGWNINKEMKLTVFQENQRWNIDTKKSSGLIRNSFSTHIRSDSSFEWICVWCWLALVELLVPIAVKVRFFKIYRKNIKSILSIQIQMKLIYKMYIIITMLENLKLSDFFSFRSNHHFTNIVTF